MRKAVVIVTLIGVQSLGSAVEIKPVIDAKLLGGQNYYNASEGNLGAVMSLNAAPYMQFNDKWSLVPLYAGHYQGTKQVTDIVGGGTPLRDSQDHTLSAKVIRSFPNDLKVKAVAGYGIELLRETKDEGWTKGLYDNRRIFTGTEAEWSWKKDNSVRLAYDYYRIRFPNYQSLESAQVNNGLGREFNQPDVLDNGNHVFSLSTRVVLPGQGLLDASASYTRREYGDQHLVLETGSLDPETRHDSAQSVSLTGTWPVMNRTNKKLFTSVGYAWTHLYSDQNHYDANQVFFNPNFYAYVTQSITNQWTLLLGPEEKTWTLNFNTSVARQSYSDRFTQDFPYSFLVSEKDLMSKLVGCQSVQ